MVILANMTVPKISVMTILLLRVTRRNKPNALILPYSLKREKRSDSQQKKDKCVTTRTIESLLEFVGANAGDAGCG